ncbi:MAG: hypothetical protein PPP55_02905 [Halorubrum sp.]
MKNARVSESLAAALSRTARSLQTARREALEAVAVTETEWEYAGRTWSWPAGEERTYFHELAPREAAVLEGATRAHGLDVLAVGTGRVAVGVPTEAVTNRSEAESTRNHSPHLVAKLARYGPSAEMGDGRSQNRRERQVSKRVDGHPFLPVLDADEEGRGDWVAMPNATVPPPEHDRAEALSAVREALAAYGDVFHFDELKPENVGKYDGRYWIVDYGRPPGEPLFVDPP